MENNLTTSVTGVVKCPICHNSQSISPPIQYSCTQCNTNLLLKEDYTIEVIKTKKPIIFTLIPFVVPIIAASLPVYLYENIWFNLWFKKFYCGHDVVEFTGINMRPENWRHYS
jgi:hypothetical protein